MWAYRPQKIANFWYKNAPKEVYPLKQFLQMRLGGGVPAPHAHTYFTIVALKMWAYSPKICNYRQACAGLRKAQPC